MKVGIIRCMQTEDLCPGTADFRILRDKKGIFEGAEGDVELVGFTSCGGCPGKKAGQRAKLLVDRGADTIVLASCIHKGTPIGYPCPFAAQLQELVERSVGEDVQVLDHSH